MRDAYGHLKAIAHDSGAAGLLQIAGVKYDDGIMAASNARDFVGAAGKRLWTREPSVRMLP